MNRHRTLSLVALTLAIAGCGSLEEPAPAPDVETEPPTCGAKCDAVDSDAPLDVPEVSDEGVYWSITGAPARQLVDLFVAAAAVSDAVNVSEVRYSQRESFSNPKYTTLGDGNLSCEVRQYGGPHCALYDAEVSVMAAPEPGQTFVLFSGGPGSSAYDIANLLEIVESSGAAFSSTLSCSTEAAGVECALVYDR